jgi:DNA-binding protein H-NS
MAKKTFVEIQRQIEQLQKEAEEIRQQEADEVLGRIKEAIAVYGFTASDLGFARASTKTIAPLRGKGSKSHSGNKPTKSTSASALPKYRDQDGNAWSGRGPRPAWFKAALTAGKAPEDLLVQ